MTDRPPEAVIWDALRGGLVTRAVALAADLRIADRLAGGPRAVAELAAESGADADTLQRLLRALASDGIFREEEPGVFANTAASEVLRGDGWRDSAHFLGGVWLQAAADLGADGAAVFERRHGADFWSWLRAHPDERAAFDRAMEQGWERRLERLLSVELRGDELVVDVAGGNGSLLRKLLDRHPAMRGVVFDLPETVRDDSALGERCSFEAGSFFERVPAGGDVYLLVTTLHDWDDEAAARILRTIRACAPGHARLVLLEGIVEEGNEPGGGKWLDLLMLALFRGRERTEAQWRTLLGASGWDPLRLGGNGVIEARPC